MKLIVTAKGISWHPNRATAPADAGPGVSLVRGQTITEDELTRLTTEDVVAVWLAQGAVEPVEG